MTLALFLAAAVSALPTVPGAANPSVTQDNIDQTICSKAKDAHGFTWVHDQRPPVSYTNKLKFAQLKALGWPGAPSLYEEDHAWSIEAAGSPTDPKNIGPEPWHIMLRYPDPVNSPLRDWGAHTKDRYENYVHREECSRSITIVEGGALLTQDWRAGYYKTFGEPPDDTPHGERG
jgi:hypothetical protein